MCHGCFRHLEKQRKTNKKLLLSGKNKNLKNTFMF